MQRFFFTAATLLLAATFAASLWPFEPVMLFLGGVLLAAGGLMLSFFAKSRAQLAFAVATVAIIVSVACTNWPMRVAHAGTRASFDRVAEQVRDGETFTKPFSIGPFRIVKAEVSRNDVVCLWTDADPSGPTGFVQCGPENPPFNIWSHTRLDDSWQFISED